MFIFFILNLFFYFINGVYRVYRVYTLYKAIYLIFINSILFFYNRVFRVILWSSCNIYNKNIQKVLNNKIVL